MVTEIQELTVEQFWEQFHDKRTELIRGVVVDMAPTSFTHGMICAKIIRLLDTHVTENKLGVILSSETGFVLDEDAKIIRAADAAFIAKENLERIEDRDKFVSIPPDLAVEVVSPHDRASDINTKVNDYLSAGTTLVWVIYPEAQEVIIYHKDHINKLTIKDNLDGGSVLPGFTCPVKNLFPDDL